MYPMYEGDGYKTGDRPGKKSDVINFQLKLRDLGETLDVDGAYGPATTAAIKRLLPTIGDKPIQDGAMYTGRNGYSVDKAWNALNVTEPGEHTHPQYAKDGHTHAGYAITTHTHGFTGTTEGATQP